MSVRARALMEPAAEVSERTPLGEVLSRLAAGKHVFARSERRWRVLEPRKVLCYPRTRQIVDLPGEVVNPVAADSAAAAILAPGGASAVVPVVDDGQLVGALRRERVRDALRLDVASTANIGTQVARIFLHDVNNALIVLRGGLELGDEHVALGMAEHLQRVTEQLQRLLTRQPSAPEQLDVAALLDELQPALSALCGHNTLRVRAPAGVTLYASRASVERVIINLVLNANAALLHSGSLITVTARDQGACCEIVVDDDGPGFPDHVIAKLSRPDEPSDDARHGIGLTSVHTAVSRCGGSFELCPRPGGGARVITRWPHRG
ncbi:MAG: HAMP domain-containing histidine kinase [Myxococcales bacterium]|nr:HAMP domain-containing histidine kinase [Myxococcales bacterium]